MKNIKDFIVESGEYEMQQRQFKYKPNSKYFWFNTEGEVCGFYTEDEIKSMIEDEPDFAPDSEILLNMNVGEIYSPDGGINQYVRIKK